MSDIWERKIRTFFRRFDLNKDGKLTREEFVSLGDGVAGNEKFDSKQKELLKQCLDDVSITEKSPTLNRNSIDSKHLEVEHQAQCTCLDTSVVLEYYCWLNSLNMWKVLLLHDQA